MNADVQQHPASEASDVILPALRGEGLKVHCVSDTLVTVSPVLERVLCFNRSLAD